MNMVNPTLLSKNTFLKDNRGLIHNNSSLPFLAWTAELLTDPLEEELCFIYGDFQDTLTRNPLRPALPSSVHLQLN